MKKRNHRVHDYQTMGKKILCAKFAERLHTNFAAGDQDNNLLLFNTLTPKPVSVLNSNTSNVSSITALSFVQSDDQVIVGSNRGSMNVWDLNTLKIGYCLKGHTVQICSFYADKKNQSILASGSSDTNAKLWDLRGKNCLYTLKNHNKRVSCVCISQDSRIMLTGGQDGAVFSFDIRMFKPIFQYQLGSPVLSMDTNHTGLVAIGCLDRSARIFQLNAPFSLYGKTKSDSMPISSCSFYKDETLFTGANDNLKAWHIGQDQTYLSDNIETSSKGIMHMIVQQKVQQIAYTGGVLSYHQCFLSQVNFNSPYTFINPNVNNSIHTDSPVLRQIKSRGKNQKIRRANSINPTTTHTNPIQNITDQKAKKLISKKTETIARELAGVHGNINDALNNLKITNDSYNNRKKEVNQLKMVMQDEHIKFLKIMGNRTKSMQTILDLWMKGNIKSVINQFKNIDIYTASDVLSQILKPSNIQISSQFASVIAQKAKQMIKNKHMSIVKNGVQYMLYIVSLFKDQMIRLKTFGLDKGVDLARQQRIKRLDFLIQQYVEVYQSKRLKKLADKNDETSNLAQKLSNQMTIIFKKVFGNQYDF